MGSSGKYWKKSFFTGLIVPVSQWEPVLKAPEPGLLQKLQRWKCRETSDVKYLLALISTGSHYFSHREHTVSYFTFKTVQSRADIKKKNKIRRNQLPKLCWCFLWAEKLWWQLKVENLHVELGMHLSRLTYVLPDMEALSLSFCCQACSSGAFWFHHRA